MNTFVMHRLEISINPKCLNIMLNVILRSIDNLAGTHVE